MNITPQNLFESGLAGHTILVVDDEPTNLHLVSGYLKKAGFQILVARDGESALQRARYAQPDLILLDVILPGIDGFEACRQLKADESLRDIPVIFMTTLIEVEDKVKGFQLGAVDYITKPLQYEEILARVTTHLHLRNLPRELREAKENLERQVEERTAELGRANEELRAEIAERKQAEQVLRRYTECLEGLRRVGLELAAQLDLKTLLHSIISMATELMGGVSGGLYLYRPERKVLELRVAVGIEQTVVGNTLQPGEGLSGRVWESGEPLAVNDYQHWAGRVSPYDELGLRATLGVPVHWGEQRLGVLVVWTDTPDQFSPSDTQALYLFADQAAIAIENARLFEQVRVARERLERLTRRLIDVQEVERRRIARELHDEIGQALTVLKVNLQTMQRVSDVPSLAPYLNGSIRTVGNTLQQVRSLSLDLRPSLLDDLGLVPALRWYVDRQAQQAGVAAHFASDSLDERLSPEVEIACFRIVQEALTNVIRHAGAEKIQVELHHGREALHLTIRDDGRGFDVQASREEAKRGESMGLLGMEERVQLLDGEIEIESEPGEGTEIRVCLPVPGLAAITQSEDEF